MPWEGLHPSSFWQLDFIFRAESPTFQEVFFEPVVLLIKQDKSRNQVSFMSQNIRVSLGCFSLETHPTVHAFYHRPSTASWFFPPTFAGWAKGKGFVGRIKKWGGKRGPMTHGSKHHRTPRVGSRVGSRVPGHTCLFFQKHLPRNSTHIRLKKKNMKDLRERIG